MNCKICTRYTMTEDCPVSKCPYLRGTLAYNPETDRFGLLVWDLWEIDGIGCGQPMEVLIDGVWKKTRMDMCDCNNTGRRGLWYLKDTLYKEHGLWPFDLDGASVRFHL